MSVLSISLMNTVGTLVFVLRRANLNNLQMLLVYIHLVGLSESKAQHGKKDAEVGAKMHPCFMPLCIVKDIEVSPP